MTAERLPVLFLWHHHQPFYHAPGAERPLLPWVRLHAARGYRDMAAAMQAAPVRMTFNLTPVLLEQLAFASEQSPADEFERLSRIPAGDLNEQERRFILRNFFSINWAVHIRPHPRYRRLLAKRGETVTEASLRQALIDYTVQDFTDLVALFNLAWIGFAGRRDPVIAELLRLGENYTSADIEVILADHRRALAEVLPLYRGLRARGQTELSVSPFSHPILPLLCDSQSAAVDIPRQQLPRPDYRHPEDAERQLRMAQQTYRDAWGDLPLGLWPSEGSVSNDALDIAAACGFRWAATDQAILQRSEGTATGPLAHFTSHVWHAGDHELRLYFRDHALSDAIGFRYAGLPPGAAVDEFVGHLERIEEATRGLIGRCAVIALDGENPWEAYPDGGEAFLALLFQRLELHRGLTTLTFSEHMQTGTREHVQQIHPGSWIDSNFRIWIGDPEKNVAWSDLGRARRVIDELGAADPRREECWRWLRYAQGSDWFWWYGEPFNSPYEAHFDELFRSYLAAIYRAADRQPPASLDVPITQPPRAERRLQPAFPIAPEIDGRETSFYEWAGATRIDPRQFGAVMGRAEHALRALYYGYSEDELLFRFDPLHAGRMPAPLTLALHVLGDRQITLTIPLELPQPPQQQDGLRWAYAQALEVAVLQERVGVAAGGECQFWVEFLEDGVAVEKLPPAGTFRFVVPTREMLAANWMV